MKKFNMTMASVILGLAWPTMVEQLMQTTVQYIDTAMVGTLGTQATAAVGATSTMGWLISGTISAIGIGFLSYIAKACGANRVEDAKHAAAQAVLSTLIVGIVLSFVVLSLSTQIPVWMQVDENIRSLTSLYFFILYLPLLPRTATIIFGTLLRAAGDTKTPMRIGILMNVINILLNFLLIYPSRQIVLFSSFVLIPGAGLGVIGAAAASAVSFTLGGLLITIILWRHPRISPKGYSIRPDMMILRPCLKIALPNMLQRFTTSLGYVVFASMINALGEIATAAHTVANTVESAFYIPGYGMQTAAATLAGNAYGAKDEKGMRELAKMFIPIEISLMFVSGVLLFVLAPVLVGLFASSQEVIKLGVTVLRMVAVSEPFYGFSIIVEGLMLGVGKTKEPFVYNVIGMWGVRIMGTMICTTVLGYGLIAAWACMIAHNLLLFGLYMICYKKEKWNPLKIENS